MDARYALSRNEEEKILKALKAQSLKVCEVPVTGQSPPARPPARPPPPSHQAAPRAVVAPHARHADKRHSVLVAAFTSCAEGRTVSVAWSCRAPFKAMQECMKA